VDAYSIETGNRPLNEVTDEFKSPNIFHEWTTRVL
jgi:hypothetical protein